MGRKGTGIEVREKSIRIAFQYQGAREKHTLMVNGKPMLPTPANVKHAHRLVAEIKDKIRHGLFSMAEYFPASGEALPITLADQLNTWLATQRIEQSSRDGYIAAINFWCSADIEGEPLGTFKLRSIRASNLLTAIASREDLAGKTINNYACVLRAALELAVVDKLITENPALHIKHAEHQKPPPDPFEPQERDQIIDYTREKYPEQIWNFVEFWFWSGLRTGEILALQWANVLLPTKRVIVSESKVAGRKKGSTKTKRVREVILNSRALAAIERQRKHTQLAGRDVFLNPRDGKPWKIEQSFRRNYWTRTLSRLGIRHRRAYNMRHTYATAMLMAGVMPAFAAKQLGHSVQVFLTTYAKWIDGDRNQAEMARLEESIAPGMSPGENAKSTST